jgi:hypothetical protein
VTEQLQQLALQQQQQQQQQQQHTEPPGHSRPQPQQQEVMRIVSLGSKRFDSFNSNTNSEQKQQQQQQPTESVPTVDCSVTSSSSSPALATPACSLHSRTLFNSSTVGSVGVGGITGSMATLQQKLLPSERPSSSGGSGINTIYRSALGGSLAGASTVGVFGNNGATSSGNSSLLAASSSIGVGSSLLSSRAATTGLAVRAQMLLTKDLTALTPRTPRVRDPTLQQQQQQQHLITSTASQQQQQQQWVSPPEVNTIGAGSSSSSVAAAGRARCSSGSSRPSSGTHRSNVSNTSAGAGAQPCVRIADAALQPCQVPFLNQ